ncbi:hypothetical protein DVH24_019058 [Malus domestica]|uniref:Uncharacterized protein n=1 Tax=Malus domestica TaxID=3750 RepID=A0A498HZB5_MALDO|nr:hypothetical protein DVH24_019058 [Malus domestica]
MDVFRPMFGALNYVERAVPRKENGASIYPILHLKPKIRLCLSHSTPPIEQYYIQSFIFYVLKSINLMSLGSVGLDWVTCLGFSSVGLDSMLEESSNLRLISMSSEEQHSLVVRLVEGACLNCFNDLRCVFITKVKERPMLYRVCVMWPQVDSYSTTGF